MQLIINLFKSVHFPENSLGIAILTSLEEVLLVAGFVEVEAISLDFGGWEELNCKREERKDWNGFGLDSNRDSSSE